MDLIYSCEVHFINRFVFGMGGQSVSIIQWPPLGIHGMEFTDYLGTLPVAKRNIFLILEY